MKKKILDWLRIFRAQTMPATLLLILVPYLTNAEFFSLTTLEIALFAVLAHYLSFGHNSLMDTYGGWDYRDPSKKHHPLVSGRVSMTTAHNVIHWGLGLLSVIAAIISIYISPNPIMALTFILLWFVWGHAYNDGLDKECVLSFLPISICFTALGLWGWFLSHSQLDYVGLLLTGYFFFTILFQISWSGHLKELSLKERSNILIKMGASITPKGWFIPGASRIYGILIKAINLIFGILLMLANFTLVRLVWYVILCLLSITMLHQLTKPRPYKRDSELFNMSLMEIFTIYMPIPLVLEWTEATILMLLGIIYFFGVNLLLWEKPHPKV